MDYFFFGLIAVVFVVVIIGSAIYSRKRREALQQAADALGLEFAPAPGDVHTQYQQFRPLNIGRNRRSRNLLHGRRGEIEWELFDYQYRTGSGKNATTHSIGVLVAGMPMAFPTMEIRPENMLDKIAAMAGFDDINFESEQFSRRYHVKCDNRRACYELIHPQMIEYLLSLPQLSWQFSGRCIALTRNGFYAPDQLEATMGMVEGFVQRIPAYVRQDGGSVARR
jgi:hypothetical protein